MEHVDYAYPAVNGIRKILSINRDTRLGEETNNAQLGTALKALSQLLGQPPIFADEDSPDGRTSEQLPLADPRSAPSQTAGPLEQP